MRTGDCGQPRGLVCEARRKKRQQLNRKFRRHSSERKAGHGGRPSSTSATGSFTSHPSCKPLRPADEFLNRWYVAEPSLTNSPLPEAVATIGGPAETLELRFLTTGASETELYEYIHSLQHRKGRDKAQGPEPGAILAQALAAQALSGRFQLSESFRHLTCPG